MLQHVIARIQYISCQLHPESGKGPLLLTLAQSLRGFGNHVPSSIVKSLLIKQPWLLSCFKTK